MKNTGERTRMWTSHLHCAGGKTGESLEPEYKNPKNNEEFSRARDVLSEGCDRGFFAFVCAQEGWGF